MYRAAAQMVFFRFTGIVLLAAAVAAPARAESTDAEPAPVTLVQAERLPFSDAEIQGALMARLLPPNEAGLPRVEVAPARAGAVIVHVGARSRVVALGERSGAGAARVVALVIAELVSAGPDATDAGDAPAAPSVTIASAPIAQPPPVDDVAEPARDATRPPTRLSLTAGAAKGTGSDDELLAGTLDVDLVLPVGGGRLRFAPSAGLTLLPTRHAGTTDEVSFTGGVVRALAPASFGRVDLLAGPVVSPYGIAGAVPDSGVLLAAEAVARLTWPLSDRLHIVGAARADAFAGRVRVHFAGGDTYATPRLQIGVAVGVAWDWS